MHIKLADFGFATNKNIHKLDDCLGTPTYMAPEIISHKKYDGQKSDIFSLGVILFGLVAGMFPY